MNRICIVVYAFICLLFVLSHQSNAQNLEVIKLFREYEVNNTDSKYFYRDTLTINKDLTLSWLSYESNFQAEKFKSYEKKKGVLVVINNHNKGCILLKNKSKNMDIEIHVRFFDKRMRLDNYRLWWERFKEEYNFYLIKGDWKYIMR